jgi:hypothetical protein
MKALQWAKLESPAVVGALGACAPAVEWLFETCPVPIAAVQSDASAYAEAEDSRAARKAKRSVFMMNLL